MQFSPCFLFFGKEMSYLTIAAARASARSTMKSSVKSSSRSLPFRSDAIQRSMSPNTLPLIFLVQFPNQRSELNLDFQPILFDIGDVQLPRNCARNVSEASTGLLSKVSRFFSVDTLCVPPIWAEAHGILVYNSFSNLFLSVVPKHFFVFMS